MLYSNYQVLYYVRASGRSPVKEYLAIFPIEEVVEIEESIILLCKNEGRLLAPHSKHIYKKIWELRIQCMNHRHRILYFIAPARKIILLSAFLKKSKKTPRSEIIKAYGYYLKYLSTSL